MHESYYNSGISELLVILIVVIIILVPFLVTFLFRNFHGWFSKAILIVLDFIFSPSWVGSIRGQITLAEMSKKWNDRHITRENIGIKAYTNEKGNIILIAVDRLGNLYPNIRRFTDVQKREIEKGLADGTVQLDFHPAFSFQLKHAQWENVVSSNARTKPRFQRKRRIAWLHEEGIFKYAPSFSEK